MKRYVLKVIGLDGLKMEDAPEPPHPGPGQVLVRMRAASLNFRDLLIVGGMYGPFVPDQVMLSDGAGDVIEVGAGVTRVKGGDRVALTFHMDWIGGELDPGMNLQGRGSGNGNDGVLQEYVCVSQHEVVLLPAHLSFEEGASLPCAAVTAWVSLCGQGPFNAGETVLTQGTGGVSIFAVQIAKLFGVRVIATSSSPDKLARLRELGADETIDYIRNPDWDQEVLALTGGRGVDVVVEVGGKGTLPRSMAAARVGGRISVVGLLTGMPEVGADLLLRVQRLHGIRVGSLEHFEQMNRAIALHGLHPVIDRVFGFEEALQAFAHLQSQRHIGKVVIRIA